MSDAAPPMPKPRPVPTPVSQPFWDALRDERVALQRCDACAIVGLLPAVALPALPVRPAHLDHGRRPRHRLHVHRRRASRPRRRSPTRSPSCSRSSSSTRACGSRRTLVDVDPDALAVGLPVEPVFDHGDDGITLLRFRPPPGADPPTGADQPVLGEDQPMGFLEDRAGLTGKVALIAGGGGGLGRAIALDYARAGMHLVLCDKNEELLGQHGRATSATSREEPLAALIDVRDADALHADLQRGRRPLRSARRAGERRRRHVQGRFRRHQRRAAGTRSSGPTSGGCCTAPTSRRVQMREQGDGGSIINITSIEGHRAAPGYAVYAGHEGRGHELLADARARARARRDPRQHHRTRPDPDRGHAHGLRRRGHPGRHPDGAPGHVRGHRRTARCSSPPTCRPTSPAPRCTPTAGPTRRRVGTTGPGSGYVNNPPASAFEHDG